MLVLAQSPVHQKPRENMNGLGKGKVMMMLMVVMAMMIVMEKSYNFRWDKV
jgi:hypothetical protein